VREASAVSGCCAPDDDFVVIGSLDAERIHPVAELTW
jgi:hypothetical protein